MVAGKYGQDTKPMALRQQREAAEVTAVRGLQPHGLAGKCVFQHGQAVDSGQAGISQVSQ